MESGLHQEYLEEIPHGKYFELWDNYLTITLAVFKIFNTEVEYLCCTLRLPRIP